MKDSFRQRIPMKMCEEGVLECKCGQGWCPIHGTYDLPLSLEIGLGGVGTLQHGTNGGRRIHRKVRAEENY